MPEIKLSHQAPSKLLLWQLTESKEELCRILPENLLAKVNQYRSPVHQKQFLAKQILLQRHHLTDKLMYLDSGKPVLTDQTYISISHSNDYVVVALSKQALGIDIEIPNPKLESIARRFVRPDDILPENLFRLEQWQWVWTAKESIYKLAGIPGLSFKNDIKITDLDINTYKGKALLNGSHNIDLYFQRINKTVLLCQAFYADQ